MASLLRISEKEIGFRFRKSTKLAPGVRINLTKKGVSSTSIGKHGATVNAGKNSY